MIIITILIAVIVFLDQITKHLASTHLPSQGIVPVLDPIFHFHYTENRGAAWNILEDHPWVFMVLSSVAILAILIFLFRNRKKQLHPVLRYGLTVIAAGGIGNMIDRIARGFVVDFIEFGFFEFPIFNVADSFITVGSFSIVIYLLIDLIKDGRNKKNASLSAKEQTTEDPVEPDGQGQDRL